jgi:hypothetical protein
MKTTATKETVILAIGEVNQEQGYKIELNRADQSGKWFNFTLKSKSGIPGARTSWSGRNLACASWHAHGYIMDKIFELEPKSIIWSNGQKYESGFDWQDKNIGSNYQPVYFSETSIL